MSERDCGKWYCQRAAGFREFEIDRDVRLWGGTPADSNDRNALDRERMGIKSWMQAQRTYGWTGWLAAYSHGNGAAEHYWVWDPDSRGKYMEAKFFEPGTVQDSGYGSLHKGLGWQLPLLAVFDQVPTVVDLNHLVYWKVPYVILGEDPPVEPPVDPPDDPDDWIWDEPDLGGNRLQRQIRMENQNLTMLGMLAELEDNQTEMRSAIELVIDFLDITEE